MAEHTCEGRVFDHWRFYNCGKRAKVERGGKWYCGIHDPERMAARQAARDAISEAQSALWGAERQLIRVERELLAWAMTAPGAPVEPVHECQRLIEMAKAALAELKGRS